MKLSINKTPQEAVQLALSERLDYADKRANDQYAEEYIKERFGEKISAYNGELANRITPEQLRMFNASHRQQCEALQTSLSQQILPSRLPPDQKLMYDNILAGFEAQGMFFNYKSSTEKFHETVKRVNRGAIILSGATQEDQKRLLHIYTHNNEHSSLKDSASMRARDILNNGPSFKTDLAKVREVQKNSEGQYLYPQDNKIIGGIAGELQRLEIQAQILNTFETDKKPPLVKNTKQGPVPLSDRIGFHWNRLNSIGPKQAAAILAGGYIDTTKTPDPQGALPGGHSYKEVEHIKAAGYPVSMVVAYRFNQPENTNEDIAGRIQNMQRYQPILSAANVFDSILVLDAEQLEQGKITQLAIKESGKNDIHVSSTKYLEHIQKISQELQLKAQLSHDQIDIEISDKFIGAFSELKTRMMDQATA